MLTEENIVCVIISFRDLDRDTNLVIRKTYLARVKFRSYMKSFKRGRVIRMKIDSDIIQKVRVTDDMMMSSLSSHMLHHI